MCNFHCLRGEEELMFFLVREHEAVGMRACNDGRSVTRNEP